MEGRGDQDGAELTPPSPLWRSLPARLPAPSDDGRLETIGSCGIDGKWEGGAGDDLTVSLAELRKESPQDGP